jgi:pimeloyl-ACP methyl ester carboxylesterase
MGTTKKAVGTMSKKTKIFILHGWAYNVEKWQPFCDLLNKQGIETVFLKIPGLTAPLETVWGLDDYVAWLKKIVDKEEGKVMLLGHSNGGRISLAFAAKYPQKVAHLILIDSAGIYHNELPIRIKRTLFKAIATLGRKLQQSERLRALLYKLAREQDYHKASPVVRKTMRNLLSVDLKKSLSQITCQTLIIWGAQDRITPLNDGKALEQGIKNASLHIVPEAKHSPQFTRPREVVKIITKELVA